jgi:prolipoprotein diacylglyceryltransferase
VIPDGLGFGGLTVPTAGLGLACALAIGWLGTPRLARDDDVTLAQVRLGLLGVLLGGAAGGRLWALLLEGGGLRGGLSPLGVVLGAGLVGALVLRGAAFLVFDAAGPAFSLGFAIERLLAFLTGAGFGRLLPADAPSWLVALGTAPAGSVFHRAQVAAGWVAADAAALPAHPVALYDALSLLGLAVLGVLVKRRRQQEGQAIAAMAVAWLPLAFALETSRFAVGAEVFGLTPTQVGALIAFPTAAGVLVNRSRPPEPPYDWTLEEGAPEPPRPEANAPAPEPAPPDDGEPRVEGPASEPPPRPRPPRRPPAPAGPPRDSILARTVEGNPLGDESE